ncbi:hypothetical protein [Streptomyces sp. CAU 1734]|uniref:hypothetical protein n=1 Tax=Streptomyces sp. CAU 1734 TaxID=3140360 RepID=UPI003261CE1E
MERSLLSQREAAAACAVSLSTIRRRRENGGFPGARQDPVRGWLIPAEELPAMGAPLNTPAPAVEPSGTEGAGDRTAPTGPDASPPDIGRLRRELADALSQRRLAEAEVRVLSARIAAQREHLEDLRRLLFGGAPGWVPAPGPVRTAGGVLSFPPARHRPGRPRPWRRLRRLWPGGRDTGRWWERRGARPAVGTGEPGRGRPGELCADPGGGIV